MKTKKQLLLSFITITLLSTAPLIAEDDNNITRSKDWVIIPYAFASESTGFAGGLGFIKQGLIQPSTTLVASLFYGATQDVVTNGKDEKANFSGGFLSFSNLRLPYTKRTFFSFIGLKSYFPKANYYLLTGKGEKKEEDRIVTSGDQNFFHTKLEYVLPLGEGIDNPEGCYNMINGFAMDREGFGGGTPFLTGRTAIGIETFYEHNEFENWQSFSQTPFEQWDTNGLRYYVKHENTDYDLNPSKGYQFRLRYSKDYGWMDSLQSWDFLEFKYNHYFNLDTFSWTQQNVLALSFWTGNSLSWDNENKYNKGIDAHRPPPWEGARLGGYNRMRGYANNLFSDKSSAYASVEYRAVLDWNPFRKNDYIPVAIDWLQVVAFAEAGKVDDEYGFNLLNDMKFDAGISFRALAAKVPVRLDIAYGDQGVNAWVMVYQPFDF